MDEAGAEQGGRARPQGAWSCSSLFMQLQKDLSEREREATQRIFDKMRRRSSARLRRPEGFTMVLDGTNAGIVYAPPRSTSPNELVRKYNGRHGARAAAAAEGGRRRRARPRTPPRRSEDRRDLHARRARRAGGRRGRTATRAGRRRRGAARGRGRRRRSRFFSNSEVPQGLPRPRAAGAVVVRARRRRGPRGRTRSARSRTPYLAFAKVSTLFHPPREPMPEVSPAAAVHPSARGRTRARQVMPFAFVGPRRGDRRAHDPPPGRATRPGAASAPTASSTRTWWSASAASSATG